MHPGGVEEGLRSELVRQEIDLAPAEIESVVARSQALSSVERLEIYARAYFARLVECLQAEFPVFCEAVGDEAFQRFAVDYLQTNPSRSYTLGRLGAGFADYLKQTRPDDDSTWPDFLVDLARLEWAFSEVYDGPGIESEPPLDAAKLRTLPAEQWPTARLIAAPCLRLMEFAYPVHGYYTAVRRKQSPLPPEPAPTFLAITRRDFVVRHLELSLVQFQLLGNLLSGQLLGEAIGRVASLAEDDLENFARDLQSWFEQWTAAGFFLAVE